MQTITPRQYLPIIQQISDPIDTNTYYVRAFIYKQHGSDAPSLIDTVDLVDRGNQRFTYQYQTPADPTGEGYFLSIIIKTYTDSEYTSESPNYERLEEKFFVKDFAVHMGGGGGVSVDYKKIKKLIKEEVSKIQPKESKISLDFLNNKVEDIFNKVKDFENKYKHLKGLDRLSKDIEILKSQISDLNKKDNKNLEKEIKKIQLQVSRIKIPKPQKADLTQVLKKLIKLEKMNRKGFRDILKKFGGFKKSFISKNKDTFMGKLLKLKEFEEKNKRKKIII